MNFIIDRVRNKKKYEEKKKNENVEMERWKWIAVPDRVDPNKQSASAETVMTSR